MILAALYSRKKTHTAKRRVKKAAVKAPPRLRAKITEAEFDKGASETWVFGSEYGGAVICRYEREQRAFLLDSSVKELRCPQGILWAAAGKTRTLFLTERGGVFVSPDPCVEPVFCALTAAEYACAFDGRFYIFSDSLLYICTEEGEIEKTVSLAALISDAQSPGGVFMERAGVRKICPLGNTGQSAVITEDKRSYIMHSEDSGFLTFERTYDNIIDLCVCGSIVCYLYKDAEGFGIIKVSPRCGGIETKARYRLCSSHKIPGEIFSLCSGIGVLFEDGSTKFLLPRTKDKAHMAKARAELEALSGALTHITPLKVFPLRNACGALCRDGIKIVSCTRNTEKETGNPGSIPCGRHSRTGKE